MLAMLRPKAYQRYAALPLLGPILDECAAWSSQRGYPPGTIRNQLKAAPHLDGVLRQQGAHEIRDLTPRTFDTAWHS